MEVILQNLTKIFPSRNKKSGESVVAVNNFNYAIPDGSLVGLLGPSGCGKSTTLYMICGLQKPTSGKIFFGENDVTELTPENRGIGLVFQNYALYPHMTVKQNIMFPLQNLKGEDKLTKEEMVERAYGVAKLVQIDELMDRKPSELSGGQQQRVAIARALVKMPRVLLLDEPLSNLDARLRLQTREEIRRIQRATNITTVFVTHDQEEAMSISDVIVVMKLGVVQQTGKPQEVYDQPANLFVAKFLGTPPINVFNGKIKDGKVYIGDDCLFNINITKDPRDEEVVAKASENVTENNDDVENTNNNVNNDNNTETDDEGVTNDVEPEIDESVDGRPVFVGIRPEGFEPADNGVLSCELSSIEVMGRDVSVVSKNANSVNPIIRSIVDADTKVNDKDGIVRFNLKSHKVFLFDSKSEKRIYFEVK